MGHKFKWNEAKGKFFKWKIYLSSIGESILFYRVVEKWNALPETIVNSTGENELIKI